MFSNVILPCTSSFINISRHKIVNSLVFANKNDEWMPINKFTNDSSFHFFFFLVFCQIAFKVNLSVLLNESLEPGELRCIHSGNVNLLEQRNVHFTLQMRRWFPALENVIIHTYICTRKYIEIIEYFYLRVCQKNYVSLIFLGNDRIT